MEHEQEGLETETLRTKAAAYLWTMSCAILAAEMERLTKKLSSVTCGWYFAS